MADPRNFFARWSRLKRRARMCPPDPAAIAPSATAAPPETPAVKLPPVESLTADSDFSVFMQPGVPEVTRNAALRRLWGSDPVFANLDGLVEYGDDFAGDFKATAVVRTVYRVLQGMPSDREPTATGAEGSSQTAAGGPTEGRRVVPAALPDPTGGPTALGTALNEPLSAADGRADNDGLD